LLIPVQDGGDLHEEALFSPYEEDRPREGVYLLGPDGHEVLLRRVVSKTDDA